MKSFMIVLGLLCALQSTLAQRRDDICANLPSGTGFVNDYRSCDMYYSCIRGEPYEARCPMPFIFNPVGPFGVPICDWPFNHRCERCPSNGIAAVAHPHSCTRYTQCINGVPMDKECAPGTAFDKVEAVCILEKDANCDNINACGRLENGTGYAPSTMFCNEFIICHNGAQFGEAMRCPDGLHFDSEQLRCALKENAVCYRGAAPASINFLPSPII